MSQEKLMNVLVGPHVSEKSARISEGANQFVFRVRRDATKTDIKAAVELMFEVKVQDVNVVNVGGKQKRFGQRLGRRPHLAMAAAGVVAMPMRDQRAGLGLRGIDPRVCRPHINAFRKRLDPGTQARHCGIIAPQLADRFRFRHWRHVMDLGGINIFFMEVVGAVILFALLVWAVMRTRPPAVRRLPWST